MADAEDIYWDALNRLLEKGMPISNNAVAKEAGNKPGSLRSARYPNVCNEIERLQNLESIPVATKASQGTETTLQHAKRLQKKAEDAMKALKLDYQVLLDENANLELALLEANEKLRKLEKDNVVSFKK